MLFRPEYGHAHGIEDKWRHTYPYVPTSYYYNNPTMPRQNPESIGKYWRERIFFLKEKYFQHFLRPTLRPERSREKTGDPNGSSFSPVLASRSGSGMFGDFPSWPTKTEGVPSSSRISSFSSSLGSRCTIWSLH